MSRLLSIIACGTLLTASTADAQQIVPADPKPHAAATLVTYIDAFVISQAAVSPDGRWVVISGWDEEGDGIWIMPAGGGERRVLFAGPERDQFPTFSPAGDRLFFISSRVNRNGGTDDAYLVSVPFNTNTGALAGDVRQVGLTPASPFTPHVAPDGQWVAYHGEGQLRVVPANGGTERVMGSFAAFGPPGNTLMWTADSRALEWNVAQSGATGQQRYRATLDGGPVLVDADTPLRGRPIPGGTYTAVANGAGAERVLRIRDQSATVVAEVPFPGLGQLQYTPDGRFLAAARRDQEASLRAVGTSGGASRLIVPANGAYQSAWGWTGAGELVYGPDSRSLRAISLRTGAIRELSLAGFAEGALWRNIAGDYGIVAEPPTAAQPGRALHLVHLTTGSRRLLTEAGTDIATWWNDHGRFIYVARADDALQVRSVAPGGSDELMRTVPVGFFDSRSWRVRGQRMAYLDVQRDTLWLMMSDGPDASPRRVIAVPDRDFTAERSTSHELTWSNDGSRIAIAGGEDTAALLIVTLPAAGRAASLQRVPTTMSYFYEMKWSPDDFAITVVGEPREGYGSGANVARIDLATQRTTLLTADDPNAVWSHIVSPDGSTVIYPSEDVKGSPIYIYDIARILREAGRS